MSKRTFKEDKLAKLYDTEVVPIWSRRFGRMLLRDLAVPNKAMVLDVNCGSGYPSLEILKRMDEGGRIIAIDTSSPMLDEARTKAGKLSGKRIFFRSEASLPKLPFAEEVYDLVIANAGLQQLDDPEPAVRECARVTKVGGQVVATYPLAGTFGEFHDLFREVLVKGDYKDALDRLDAYLTRYPPLEQAVGWFEDAGLSDVTTEFETFTLLFKSSREFFFAPIIEYGPLSVWKAIAGKGQQMQDVFWQTKGAIDAYFHGSAFSVTVNAGCVRGRKLATEARVTVAVPAEPSKGVRASSGPKRRADSGSRRSEVPDSELPDAPSDDVEALSGSWPAPSEDYLVRPEPTGGTGAGSLDALRTEASVEVAESLEPTRDNSGLSVVVDDGEIVGDEPVAAPPAAARDFGPTIGLDEISELAELGPSPEPFSDEEFDREAAKAFDAERAAATLAPQSDDGAEDDLTPPPADVSSVTLGSSEIELVEGSESNASNPHVKRVRRPDEPDDPDLF